MGKTKVLRHRIAKYKRKSFDRLMIQAISDMLDQRHDDCKHSIELAYSLQYPRMNKRRLSAIVEDEYRSYRYWYTEHNADRPKLTIPMNEMNQIIRGEFQDGDTVDDVIRESLERIEDIEKRMMSHSSEDDGTSSV